MARTNRTASQAHRRWRQRLITQARQQGQTECPLCGVTITWTHTTCQPAPKPTTSHPSAGGHATTKHTENKQNNSTIGLVVMKQRNKPWSEAYVVSTLNELLPHL